ncbi:unnamed protein product, partial [Symbiodinium pilosum]
PGYRSLSVAIDSGDPKSNVVLLFLHGWPDNAKVWHRQISAFVGWGYHCVAAELPMCGEHGEKAAWGYDFNIVAKQLANLAQQLRTSEGGNRSLVLIGHDWGAWLTYMAQRAAPHLFDAIIPLDIAPGYGQLPFSVQWRIVAYQHAALSCFALSKLPFLSVFLARVNWLRRGWRGAVPDPLGRDERCHGMAVLADLEASSDVPVGSLADTRTPRLGPKLGAGCKVGGPAA